MLLSIYIDVDECTDATDLCEIDCHNTVGSYLCDCIPGCTLNTDTINCDGMLNSCFTLMIITICSFVYVDIDECDLDISGCNQVCSNLDCVSGRFECSCNPGYSLTSDGHTCLG